MIAKSQDTKDRPFAILDHKQLHRIILGRRHNLLRERKKAKPPATYKCTKARVGSIKEPSSEKKFDGLGVEFCGNRTLMINRADGHESPSNDAIPEKVFESMKCHICRTEREGHN